MNAAPPSRLLRDGLRIPQVGLGVFRTPSGPETRSDVGEALACGYRHIDTACIYGNEADVAEAVRESGRARDQVFVTTKIWNDAQGYEETRRACEQSRMRFEHEYAANIPVTSYGLLWRWLYEQLPADVVDFERAAIGVTSTTESANLSTSDGRERAFDLVVASDGGASELRRRVLGGPAVRRYAGYVLWHGVVSMAKCGRLGPELEGRLTIANRVEQHFVAYPIPHPTLGLAVHRGWYHPTSTFELAELDDRVGIAAPHVLGRCGGAFEKLEHALASAAEAWPAWVRALVERTIADGVFAPHPVFEFAPDTMVRDRLVVVGDAAHLASPITGSGGRMAMADAIALRNALGEGASITEDLVFTAPSMSTSRQKAATSVSTGMVPVAQGATTPAAPGTCAKPRSFTRAGGQVTAHFFSRPARRGAS
jgi:2-polyprenyl-6-methoxyphenol hydroxylase-like FAD-dependent oxidoreductase